MSLRVDGIGREQGGAGGAEPTDGEAPAEGMGRLRVTRGAGACGLAEVLPAAGAGVRGVVYGDAGAFADLADEVPAGREGR